MPFVGVRSVVPRFFQLRRPGVNQRAIVGSAALALGALCGVAGQ